MKKLRKLDFKIRKIWHFEISHFFRKTLLDQSLWIFANEGVDDVQSWGSQFFIYMCSMKFWTQIFIFTLDTGKNISPYAKCIRVNGLSGTHLLWVVIRRVLYSHSWNLRWLSFLYMKWIENCEGMTIINLLYLNIQQGLVKKCFPKRSWESAKCHNFLISYPIFIIFALVLYWTIFSFSFKIY